MLLKDIIPSFCEELTRLLVNMGEIRLADQVQGLNVVDRCSCGGESCSTFYTTVRPRRGYGPGHRNVALEPEKGMLVLDVVNDVICQVEILDREDIRSALERSALFPPDYPP
jgi:hypothetical protein